MPMVTDPTLNNFEYFFLSETIEIISIFYEHFE